METAKIQTDPQSIQQTIDLILSNLENTKEIANRRKKRKVYEDKEEDLLMYVVYFSEHFLTVKMEDNKPWICPNPNEPEFYTLDEANLLCEQVMNGHNQYPVMQPVHRYFANLEIFAERQLAEFKQTLANNQNS